MSRVYKEVSVELILIFTLTSDDTTLMATGANHVLSNQEQQRSNKLTLLLLQEGKLRCHIKQYLQLPHKKWSDIGMKLDSVYTQPETY